MNEHSLEPQPQPQEHALANKEPWLVYIDVYLESDADPKNPKFRVASYLPYDEVDLGGGKKEKFLKFENNCRPGFKILFQLHDVRDDQTNGTYRFPKHDDDAVWSKRGKNKCPRASWGRNEVFRNPKVLDDKTLRVRFDNEKDSSGKEIGPFRYTLNVTTDGEKPYLELDPGGTGSNGPSQIT